MTTAMMEVEPSTPAEDTAAVENNENVDSTNTTTNNSSPTSAVANVYAKDTTHSKQDDETMADAATTAITVSNNNNTNTAVVFSPELLQMYYSRLFPFELLHTWLAYDPTTSPTSSSPSSSRQNNNNNNKYAWLFSRREFSMTIEPSPGEEIYLRYQSFADQQELTNAILKRRPTKIDLGAIFSVPPRDHKTLQKSSVIPIQRELVFDIDLTDYDDIRHCGCTGAQICPKCWVFMTMAVEVMEVGLREDFGFDHVAWFYSGRRGIHAWVCDETARTLTNEARNAVATYFEVQLANENNKDIELSLPLHPSLQRAFDILEPWFVQEILPASGHGLLASPKRWKHDLLDHIPEAGKAVASLLEKKWASEASTPAQKWDQLLRHIKVLIGRADNTSKFAKTMSNRDKARLEHWPIEVVFRHTYPRLDINVSKTMNHLLKSPFCVHPKTGRVCVPIQAQDIRHFDPFVVPTLSQLVSELDDFEKQLQEQEQEQEQEQQCSDTDEQEETTMQDKDESANNEASNSIRSTKRKSPKYDWQKTSLKEYFEPFQQNFLDPMLKELRKQDKMQAEQEAALRGDF